MLALDTNALVHFFKGMGRVKDSEFAGFMPKILVHLIGIAIYFPENSLD